MPLCDALRDPQDVPALLLFQFHVGVEDSKVELVQESESVKFHLEDQESNVCLSDYPAAHDQESDLYNELQSRSIKTCHFNP